MNNSRGFSLIEVLLAATLIAVAGMTAVAYVTRAAGHADWASDKVFARQKALSIIAEMRAFVEGGEGEFASDLDGFDDGVSYSPVLTISPNPHDPGALVEPGHPLSGNYWEDQEWRWFRQISVRPLQGSETRDLRACSVAIFRMRKTDVLPGERMAEVSAVIRTVGEAFPSTQVFDLYLLALENVPGWWVDMGAMRPFVENTLQDLELRNPGLEFRLHWITTLGYGRDEEYAPYTNQTADSLQAVPWTYFYPGSMPVGEATHHYYVPDRIRARINIDGTSTAQFRNGDAPQEAYWDSNANERRDPGERFEDENRDGRWNVGNEAPYALADMHNHCKRYPEAAQVFDARVAAQLDEKQTPTWRLLLDAMYAHPERYHNAILINLHGELLPMPPTRNFSDAACDPEVRQGWRVVTHPERIRPHRVAGDAASSLVPRFRVHAWKNAFPTGHEPLMTQREPLQDLDANGVWDTGELYEDWNGNGVWDAGVPMTVAVRDGDFSTAVNDATTPSLVLECLAGGIDADGDGTVDAYDDDFRSAPVFPEVFGDTNNDGIRQVAEVWLDLNGNGARDADEPFAERDGDGRFTGSTETLTDANGNDRFDGALPAETFTDANANGRWDPAEPYWDRNRNGVRDGPTNPAPPAWKAWDPAAYGTSVLEEAYIADYGEPFLDQDGDDAWDGAETFFDANRNGVCDGGFARGEMWAAVGFDSASRRTVLTLHGTPLETPAHDGRGLPEQWRLYDLEHVPCPTPASAAAGGDRFARHLGTSGDFPKNTARWRITLPFDAVKREFQSAPGRSDGDEHDRVIAMETRLGTDLTTGRMWPTWHKPQNLSTSYAWWCDEAEDVPFSERFQMRGDPRFSPYEDTDQHGDTAANGYNWFWDDLDEGTDDARGAWLAFDGGRLRDGWLGRTDFDTPRLMQWLRSGLVRSEAIFTTMTGFSYYYLSCGGDVGADSANGYANSIPVDGLPYGEAGDTFEDTIRRSRRLVRANAGSATGLRAGGYWWSKPFLGELFPDEAYSSDWKPSGNLRAGLATGAVGFRQFDRSSVTVNQQPYGTTLGTTNAHLAEEGSTSFFNIGTATSTFHHQFADGETGKTVDGGLELAQNYGYAVPPVASISRPFRLDTNDSGGVGDEFDYTNAYPRFSAEMLRTFYDHESGSIGSGLVHLQEPGHDPRGAFIVVNGLSRTIDNGTSLIARYSVLSLIHSFFEAGLPGTPNRIRLLPRVEITAPTLTTELLDPSSIEIEWDAEWKRWDGKAYTSRHAADFAESEDDTIYVPLYSRDNGKTWRYLMTDTPAEAGVVPWSAPGVPAADRTLGDRSVGAAESWTWSTPADRFPKGSYLIRIEAHRRSESSHYAVHMEKIYVDR